MANGGGWKDGRMEGCLEIPPCVLQDIGPLGPLAKRYSLIDGQSDEADCRVKM